MGIEDEYGILLRKLSEKMRADMTLAVINNMLALIAEEQVKEAHNNAD